VLRRAQPHRSRTRTSTDIEWVGHAAGLVAALTDSGDLHDPAWAAASAATPRHLLVPTAYQQQHEGSWDKIDTTGLGLGLAYSHTTLVTEIDNDGSAISSSTKPDLMVRMLATLNIHDGHRVLEIGTGYNVAPLCHRLGTGNVFSLDLNADLVATARKRLADIGYYPQLAARDGIDGWPHHAPYDRIIATCSLPRIPWTWAQQLAADGRLLADVTLGTGAGNLALLHRYHDRLEGRFIQTVGRFHGTAPRRRHHSEPSSHSRDQPPARHHHTRPALEHRPRGVAAGLPGAARRPPTRLQP